MQDQDERRAGMRGKKRCSTGEDVQMARSSRRQTESYVDVCNDCNLGFASPRQLAKRRPCHCDRRDARQYKK